MGPGTCHESTFNLRSMTIRAQKHTLLRLLAETVDASTTAALTQAKGLGGGIELVEVKRARKLRVPAKNAPAPGLGDQPQLRSSPPVDHTLLATLHAPVVAAPLEDEPGFAVGPANLDADALGIAPRGLRCGCLLVHTPSLPARPDGKCERTFARARPPPPSHAGCPPGRRS